MTAHVNPHAPGQAEWDARYQEQSQLWSGEPNGALLAETEHLTPGRVLDVGCGEGADAIWLAQHGWNVTGLEVSQVALDRAAERADEAGVHIDWVHSGLVEAGLHAQFDLVSAMYPALPSAAGDAAVKALLDAVAPGGTLLFVHHAHEHSADHGHGHGHVHEHGHQHEENTRRFNPDDFVSVQQVRVALGAGWQIEVDELRERAVPEGGAGAQHRHDEVLRAVKLK